MARGVGLDAGAHEVKVVELDGSYRKPRLSKVSIDRVTGGGSARHEAEAALHALKDQHIRLDSMSLGYPCREAVLRSLRIPFVGDDAIRKVIKFEAESSIHSHSVDDMVVDFLTFERGDGESSVLVAAVPKKPLGALLDALEREGIEPERVDLDTMALYRAAEWAGCFGEEAAAKAAESSDVGVVEDTVPSLARTDGRKARVVIDVGARSTRVLAVIDGKLVDMRALRIGVDSIAEAVAAEYKLELDAARDAARNALERHEDVGFVLDEEEVDEAVPEEGAAESDAALPAAANFVTFEFVEAARAHFLQKLGRELLRFLTALPRITAVERVFITGGAAQLPGVREVIGESLGTETEDLDVLSGLSHDLSPEEVERVGRSIAVAVGLALGMMGAPGGFDLRREDLAYKRRFDRVKFPLAIVAMLAVFLPFIYGLRVRSQVIELEKQYGKLHSVTDAVGPRGGQSSISGNFFGFVSRFMSNRQDYLLTRYLSPKEFETLTRDIIERPTFQRLPRIREVLDQKLKQKQAETSIYEDLQLPSGVLVLSKFSEVLKSIETELGEFLVTDVDLSIPATKNSKYLQVRFAFRGEDYRTRFERLRDALEASFASSDSPFIDFKTAVGVTGEQVFTDPEIPGMYAALRMQIKDEFSSR